MTAFDFTFKARSDVDEIITYLTGHASWPTAEKYLGLLDRFYQMIAPPRA